MEETQAAQSWVRPVTNNWYELSPHYVGGVEWEQSTTVGGIKSSV